MSKILSRIVQFLTGHNKLKRHKNIQDGVTDPHSCRLCLDEEESLFYVIGECPVMQYFRSRAFKLPIPTPVPNPPVGTAAWTSRNISQNFTYWGNA